MATIQPYNTVAKYDGKCHSCGSEVKAGTGRLARLYYEYGDKIGKFKQYQKNNEWIVYCDTCKDGEL